MDRNLRYLKWQEVRMKKIAFLVFVLVVPLFFTYLMTCHSPQKTSATEVGEKVVTTGPEKEEESSRSPTNLVEKPEVSLIDTTTAESDALAGVREKLDREREKLIRFRLVQHHDGNSVFSYAEYLFSSGRFSEVSDVLEECLAGKGCKNRGEILKKGLKKVLASTSEQARNEIQSSTLFDLFDVHDPDGFDGSTFLNYKLIPMLLIPPLSANDREQLERENVQLGNDYESEGENAEAERLYGLALEEFRESPVANAQYVRFLIRQGRMTEALERVAEATRATPALQNDPQWLVISQVLAVSNGLPSSEVEFRIEQIVSGRNI